jgi:HEPN domain-containing protein
VYWEQSAQDLLAARTLLKRKEFLRSSFLSLQAAVNGLSAVAHLHGHFQLPTGGPARLLGLCGQEEPRFGEQVSAFPALERVIEQEPFSPERRSEEEVALGRQCLEEGERLLNLVRSYLKENQGRFFAP